MWETLLTFYLFKHMACTCLLLMPVMCGVLFLLNILCLMADKFCYVFCCFNIVFATCEPTFPSSVSAVKTLANSYHPISVANSCRCRCEEFWSKRFVSKQFAFLCRLFITHQVCKCLKLVLGLTFVMSRQVFSLNSWWETPVAQHWCRFTS